MSHPVKHALLCLSMGIVWLLPAGGQECTQTAQNQIETVLDKSTNRVLLREVTNDFGEEGNRILVQIASDQSQPAKRRSAAIGLLGEYRSDAGKKLLLQLLDEHNTICVAINGLQWYRTPDLVPLFMNLLDDRHSCGNMVRFNNGGHEKDKQTEVFVSDEAVGALERSTGIRLEQENDLFVIGHRATQPWKDWWKENRTAFAADPSRFVPSQVDQENRSENYPCSVQTIAVSPNGAMAFSAGKSYDPWVRAWNIETRWQLWATPSVRDDDAQDAAFSPDGRLVVEGTSNGAAKVFDAATGRRLRTLIIGRGVDSVAFNPDGAVLALASDDGSIRLFDTKSWCETKQVNNSDITEKIAFSPDGSWLAAATFEKVRLWDIATGTELRSFLIRPAKSPKIFADAGERQAELWRMAWQVAFSPDGKLLATGSGSTVQLWNPMTGQEVFATSSNGQVNSLHFSPDGEWVIWGNDRDEIVKWNPSKRIRDRIKNKFSLGDTAITPDGKMILSPGAGNEIGIYELETGRKAGALQCTKESDKSKVGH
jgi:WD40 repeat protein